MKTEERNILKIMQFLCEVDYENAFEFGVVITNEELSLNSSFYFGWLDISYKDSNWLCKATSYADEIIYDLRFAENNVDALFAFLASYISPDNSKEMNIEDFEVPDEVCDFAEKLREIIAVAKLRKAYLSFCGITNIRLQGLLESKGKEYYLVVEYDNNMPGLLEVKLDIDGLNLELREDSRKPFTIIDVLAAIIRLEGKYEDYFDLCNTLRKWLNENFEFSKKPSEDQTYSEIIIEALVRVLSLEGEVVLPSFLIDPSMSKQNKPMKIISPFGSLKNICPEHEGIEWIFEYSA